MTGNDYLAAAQRWSERLSSIERDAMAVRGCRDTNIIEAHTNGATIAELSRATGLTRTMLYRILDREG